jgi:RNA polymerase sigma factor (sigma-70 family)
VVKQFRRGRFTIDELVSEGILGLMRAIELWNPEQPYAFSTYAVIAIRGELFKMRRKLRAEIRNSENHVLSVMRWVRPRGKLTRLTLAGDGEFPVVAIGQESTVGFVFTRECDDNLEGAIDYERRFLIEKLMRRLTERQKKMIYSRYGFGSEPKTLEQMAYDHKITKERIRQILLAALDKLHTAATRPLGWGGFSRDNIHSSA